MATYPRRGLDGIGSDEYAEDFGPLDVPRFRYLYVGLPRLDALEYLNEANPLAPALPGPMKSPADRKAWLKACAAERIRCGQTNEFQEFLLLECRETYLTLGRSEQAEFDQLLQTAEFRETGKMIQLRFDQVREEGRQLGREEGDRNLVLQLLERRFGKVPRRDRQRVKDWPAEQLADLALRIGAVASLKELGLDEPE